MGSPVPVDICIREGLGGAWRATRAMPVLALDTIVLAAAADVAMRVLLGTPGDEQIPRAVAETVLYAMILAPFCVAVHRFLLHGAVTARFSLSARDAWLWRFISASLALSLLTLAGFLVGAAAIRNLQGAAGTMVFAAVFAAVTTILVRATLLLPALATGAPGAGWGNAFADSAGHGWRIFAVLTLVSLPFVFAMMPVAAAMPSGAFSIEVIAGAMVGAVFHVGWSAALAAAAATIYRLIGARLKRPPLSDAGP